MLTLRLRKNRSRSFIADFLHQFTDDIDNAFRTAAVTEWIHKHSFSVGECPFGKRA
jgi:hypothetical protein